MHRLHFKVPKTNIADFISYSTVLLKSWIILCPLSVYMVALLYFYFEWVHHVELAITQLHFEVTKISFFVILQMRTTIHYKNSISRSVNSCPTVSTHRVWRNMKWLDAVQKRRFPNKLGTRNLRSRQDISAEEAEHSASTTVDQMLAHQPEVEYRLLMLDYQILNLPPPDDMHFRWHLKPIFGFCLTHSHTTERLLWMPCGMDH